MKNELMVTSKENSLTADLWFITKYSTISVYLFTKRQIPEIKLAAEIAGEKAFLAFDFIFTLLYELIPIAILAVGVFLKWVWQLPVTLAVREFLTEMRLAIFQVILSPWLSTAIFLREIGGEMRYLWRFRQELINEYE